MTEQLSLIGGGSLSREEGLDRLQALAGRDLRPLADEYGITVFREGRLNKGWAGQVVERYLGRSPNSDRGADFGDWELKAVPVTFGADGAPRVKESMAIAMFTEKDLESQPFESSHMLEKLHRLVVVARTYEGPGAESSTVLGGVPFDLSDPEIYRQVREDYEEARWVVREQGAFALEGRIGKLVQPRVKGSGGGLTQGHCFYARSQFVGFILGLGPNPLSDER